MLAEPFVEFFFRWLPAKVLTQALMKILVFGLGDVFQFVVHNFGIRALSVFKRHRLEPPQCPMKFLW
jgi:hypothetical protein